MKFQIQVYLDDGRVYGYEVDSAEKVREHTQKIAIQGYRRYDMETETWEVYPAHRIDKIKGIGGKMDVPYLDKCINV